MQKQCDNCEIVFDFTKEDIVMRTHIETQNATVSRKPIVKKRFLRETEYSGIETHLITQYLVDEKAIVCPVCGRDNILCEAGRKAISEHKEEKTVDGWDMFGPNHPSICENPHAMAGWAIP